MPIDGKQLKKRYESLKASPERGLWESHCEEVAEVIMPRKVGFSGARSPGEKKMQRVYSSVGVRANELRAAGLHGFATNPATKWFSLAMADERLTQDPAVKKWLSDVEDIMWTRMYAPGTRFITALHEVYLELGAFGTTSLYVDWTEKDNHLKFECRSLKDIVVAESNTGLIDTYYRKFRWTARQIKMEWGNKMPDRVKNALQSREYDKEFEIVHAVFPREDFDLDNFGSGSKENMPIASVYFDYEDGFVYEEGGYPESPGMFPRESKLAGEVYGRSVGMTALPDIKMMQEIKLTTLKAGQKAVDPVLFARDDGFVNPMRLIPGGVNFVRGRPSETVFPMPFTGNLPYAQQEMEILRNEIFDVFNVDQLQIVNDARMTATEVMQRTQERMRLLGPMLGRLESELLGPLVTRVYGILHRLGLLPPAPEEIEDREFTVQYVSPIAQAQRAVEIDTWRQFVGANEVYLQAPETAMEFFQLYPVRKVAQHFAKLLNLDPDMGASDEEIQAGQQQGQMQQLAQMAQPFQQAAAGLNQLTQAGAAGGEAVQGLVSGAQGASDAMSQIDPNQLRQITQGIQQQYQ